jgi:hypothetical protein
MMSSQYARPQGHGEEKEGQAQCHHETHWLMLASIP